MRRFGKNPGRTCVFALLGACVFGMAGVAHAGGFEIPDNGARALGRGGANTVAVKDLTALQYNPGAIARLKGSRIMWHHNLVWHESSFQRAPLGEGWGPKAGTTFEKADNSEGFFGLGGFVGLSLDLGDFSKKAQDFSIALGIYGPSAVGKSDYRKTITDPATGKKVKDNYGPQSFMLNNTDLILVYYSLAFAWEVPNKFGIGLTLQAADLQRMKYGLVVDSTAVTGLGSLTAIPNGASGQLQTELNLKDHFAPTAILGMWWRPIRNLELGFSTRFIPIHLEPEGGVKVDKPSLISDELHAKLELNLPPIVRAGLRYVHMDGEREVFDIEADVVWEGWSSIDEYRINMTGENRRADGQRDRDREGVEGHGQRAPGRRLERGAAASDAPRGRVLGERGVAAELLAPGFPELSALRRRRGRDLGHQPARVADRQLHARLSGDARRVGGLRQAVPGAPAAAVPGGLRRLRGRAGQRGAL
jgi:hypothetical protein